MIAELVTAIVLSVSDGDTFRVQVPTWSAPFHTWAVRVRGVDTPELHGKCESERQRARKAKVFLIGALPIGATVTLTHVDFDKFGGRLDAAVTTPGGEDLMTRLLREHLAAPYTGEGKRKDWCADGQ